MRCDTRRDWPIVGLGAGGGHRECGVIARDTSADLVEGETGCSKHRNGRDREWELTVPIIEKVEEFLNAHVWNVKYRLCDAIRNLG